MLHCENNTFIVDGKMWSVFSLSTPPLAMDGYENPFDRRARNPAPMNSFQRELEQKMQDRRKKGLATDITPHESEQGSDGELPSDDGIY